MKTPFWAACAAAFVVWSPPAEAVSARDLLRQCEAVERGAVVKGSSVELPAGRAPAECWFYMAAVQDFAATVERQGGPSLLGACVPPETTRLDILRAFTAYARSHRSELDVRASAVVVQALGAAFPCRP